ncbi:hypothetical protein ABE957_16025 [Halomonas sp. CS7]|uniref:Uncharacterized protein n=1 Tax=Halomonas pelophila TaxID=3151122 RepID=A0ABV1N8X4_9GAMM
MTALLDHLLTTPLLAIALTLAAQAAGARLLRALGAPAWCPSILAAALLLAVCWRCSPSTTRTTAAAPPG